MHLILVKFTLRLTCVLCLPVHVSCAVLCCDVLYSTVLPVVSVTVPFRCYHSPGCAASIGHGTGREE